MYHTVTQLYMWKVNMASLKYDIFLEIISVEERTRFFIILESSRYDCFPLCHPIFLYGFCHLQKHREPNTVYEI